jgi:nucleotide-binding universal stress UspA family protein
MRVPPRLFAVTLFVAVGMLALIVAGMLDWIVGVLFLTMEFLGETVRNVFKNQKERRHPTSRARHASPIHPRARDGHRGIVRRRSRPRRRPGKHAEIDPSKASTAERRMRILVPVHGDEADLLEFALEECRSRQAELIVLFLRPIAVTPMGPNPLPGLAEDEEASATFERLIADSGRVGVPLQTLYATTSDIPSTIGEFARSAQADVVLVGSTRRGGFSRFLSRDLTPSILKLLPEHASLTIRAS